MAPSLPPERLPRHVAIIMDGNGRWATGRFLPRVEGHRQGAKSVRSTVEECVRLGIRYLTVYAFSSENWQRPLDEVSALMGLFERYLASEQKELSENGVRLRAIGDRSRLSQRVQEALARAEEVTAGGTRLDFTLAISYGGRDEIVRATKRIGAALMEGTLSAAEVTEERFSQFLDAPDVPPVDLLIRTGNEFRISNFLLWQIAYAEIVVSPLFWPDFTPEEFRRCLNEYSGRERRFGKTKEQLREAVPPVPMS